MKKQLPQPSSKRIGEAISKHLAPAYLDKLQMKSKGADYPMDITEKLKANHYRLAAIKEEVERAKAEQKEQEKKEHLVHAEKLAEQN